MYKRLTQFARITLVWFDDFFVNSMADIHVEVVDGFVKNIEYRAGDTKEVSNKWLCFQCK